MPTNFNTDFARVGEAIYSGQKSLSPAEQEALYKDLKAGFFEQLMLFDRISIKIEGDNYPLAILVHELGLDLVCECIQDGTIELYLWTQELFITISDENGNSDDESLKGIPALHAGRRSSPRHSDPEISINHALRILQHSYSKKEKEGFVQKVAYRVKLDTENFIDSTKELILSAYKSNHLANVGLPFIREPDELTVLERRKLMGFASEIIDVSFMASQSYTSFNKYNSNLIAESVLDKIGKALKISGGMNEIITLEKMPDLKTIFLQEKIDFHSAVKLRNKEVSQKFRTWLSTATDTNEIYYITKLYLDEITSSKGFFETTKGKIAKNVLVTTFGASVGSFFDASLLGAIGGASADFGLGLFDSFIFEKLSKGWTPRMYVDELRAKVKKFEEE